MIIYMYINTSRHAYERVMPHRLLRTKVTQLQQQYEKEVQGSGDQKKKTDKAESDAKELRVDLSKSKVWQDLFLRVT